MRFADQPRSPRRREERTEPAPGRSRTHVRTGKAEHSLRSARTRARVPHGTPSTTTAPGRMLELILTQGGRPGGRARDIARGARRKSSEERDPEGDCRERMSTPAWYCAWPRRPAASSSPARTERTGTTTRPGTKVWREGTARHHPEGADRSCGGGAAGRRASSPARATAREAVDDRWQVRAHLQAGYLVDLDAEGEEEEEGAEFAWCLAAFDEEHPVVGPGSYENGEACRPDVYVDDRRLSTPSRGTTAR